MLPEENTFNNIQATVAQARMDFQASVTGDAKERDQAAAICFEALNKAVVDVDNLEEVIQMQIEQVPAGRGKTTHPKRDDPYYRLLRKAVFPFIIELRHERDDLAGQLEQRCN